MTKHRAKWSARSRAGTAAIVAAWAVVAAVSAFDVPVSATWLVSIVGLVAMSVFHYSRWRKLQ